MLAGSRHRHHLGRNLVGLHIWHPLFHVSPDLAVKQYLLSVNITVMGADGEIDLILTGRLQHGKQIFHNPAVALDSAVCRLNGVKCKGIIIRNRVLFIDQYQTPVTVLKEIHLLGHCPLFFSVFFGKHTRIFI